MSHKQPLDLPIGIDHPLSAFIEEINDKHLFVPSPGPQLIGHATIQHIDNLDFISSPGPARSQVTPPTDDSNEAWVLLTLMMTHYHSLVTPNLNYLVE